MIIQDENFLRQVSQDASASEAIDIIKELEKEYSACDNAAGLSAIQIGIKKNVSIINAHRNIILINPEIIEKDSLFIFSREGCLSFPQLFVKTKRYEHFIISNKRIVNADSTDPRLEDEVLYFYFDAEKSRIALECIAVQHEIDHMRGLILPDIKWDCSKTGRNDPCPCKSGKKYKKCCANLLEVRYPFQ